MKIGNTYNGIVSNMYGEIEYTGLLLYVFYATEKKVKDLLGLGNLRVLGARLGYTIDIYKTDKGYYDRFKGQCISYSRDERKSWSLDRKERLEIDPNIKYTYVYEGNQWGILTNQGIVSLEDILIKELNNKSKSEIQNIVNNISNLLTQEEKGIFNTKVKGLIRLKEVAYEKEVKANYIIEKIENGKYYVIVTLNNSRVELNKEDIEELIKEGSTIVRKWGKGYRKFNI